MNFIIHMQEKKKSLYLICKQIFKTGETKGKILPIINKYIYAYYTLI